MRAGGLEREISEEKNDGKGQGMGWKGEGGRGGG